MKKSGLLLCAFFAATSLFSQSFQKGNFEFHAGVGFGVYSFTANTYEDEGSTAAPGLINLGGSYQISDGFALGLDFERNGFITDSSNQKAVSQNFGITASYNIVNSDKNVLYAFLTVGVSNFRFDHFSDQEYVTSRGSQVQLGLGWKHAFNENVGFYLNTSLPYYSYNEFKDSDGNTWEDSRIVINTSGQAKVESRVVNGVMTGVNFRLGLYVKFGS